MISAMILPNGVEITGHAGAGPYGHDLVCAAVSGLIMALAAVFSEKNMVNTCDIKPGHALVTTFDPRCKYIDVIEAGLNALQRKYPKNISVFSCRQGDIRS